MDPLQYFIYGTLFGAGLTILTLLIVAVVLVKITDRRAGVLRWAI